MAEKDRLPKELHKYISSTYALSTLQSSQLHLSSLLKYNDLSEALPANYNPQQDGDTRIHEMEHQLQKINNSTEGKSFLESIGITESALAAGSLLTGGLWGALAAGAILLWNQQKSEKNEDRRERGVQLFNNIFRSIIGQAKSCCFSENHVNPVMWAHYASDSSGIVVSFNPSVRYWGNIQFRKVHYCQKRAALPDHEVSETEYAWELITRKGPDWAYEEEWRLIDFTAKERNSLAFNPESVTAIRIGQRMDEKTRNKIVDLCRSKYPKAQLYIMIPNDGDDYELRFKRI